VAYDAGRGLAVGGRRLAVAHAVAVTRAEQRLGLFVEPHIHHAARSVPGLDDLFGFGYDTFHIGVTAAVLLWLYRRPPAQLPDRPQRGGRGDRPGAGRVRPLPDRPAPPGRYRRGRHLGTGPPHILAGLIVASAAAWTAHRIAMTATPAQTVPDRPAIDQGEHREPTAA
jgi:hypothetical protein